MKITDYKGYEIHFNQYTGGDGAFSADGIGGLFETFKKITTKIDSVISTMIKTNPIDVVSKDMEVGKITSYNKAENEAWFTNVNGKRSKENIIPHYLKKPFFYKATALNLSLVEQCKSISEEIIRLNKERSELSVQLTEPLTFDS